MDKFDFLYKLVNEKREEIVEHPSFHSDKKYFFYSELQYLMESAKMLYEAQEQSKRLPFNTGNHDAEAVKYTESKDFYSAEGI